jgi:hypothetical protein
MNTITEAYQQSKYWYHASPNQFDQFDVSKSDLGPHFGNLEQAIYVIQNRLSGNGNLYKTKIKVNNPLNLKDVGSFHADNIADQLLKKKLISKQDYAKYTEKDAWGNRKVYNQEIRDMLINHGYDSVRYQNNHEGRGVCVIPFDSNDITIVDIKQYQNNELSEDLIRCLKLAGIAITESINPIDNTNGAGLTSKNQDVDYFGKRVMMKPTTFLKLAAPSDSLRSKDGLKTYVEGGGKLASPMLTVEIPHEWRDGDFSKPPQVTGHEGRNRMSAIKELYGDIEVETHLFVYGLRNRNITDEMLNNINAKCVSETGIPLNGTFFTIINVT